MTVPAVNVTELDGSLGVLPPSSGKLYALLGVASSGPINTPVAYARVKDLVAAFTSGPTIEAAAEYIGKYSKPVLFTRSGNSTAGSVTAVVTTATGTAVVTITASPTPNDDYEFVLKIIAGGTRGTAGITYQLSLDGGRTFGATTALGTGTSITIPGAGGVSFSIATGTLVAGDMFTARSTAPQWNNTELASAFDALTATAASWELVHIVGALDATSAGVADGKIAGMAAAAKRHAWIGNARMPNIGETDTTYQTALASIPTTFSTIYGSFYAGAIKLVSSVSGRKYKRPLAFIAAAREASVSEEVNIADTTLPPFTGTSIRDANGNPDEHDEAINPGLDDLGFGTARTFDGTGVYITRPRIMCPGGSDFSIMPYRRVINLGESALDAYFRKRLNRPVRVNKTTGFIIESEALEIESGALAAMRAVLMTKPKASDVQFTLSRTDNLLSTKTMNGSGRIIPLAYTEFINLDVGYYNPALQLLALAA